MKQQSLITYNGENYQINLSDGSYSNYYRAIHNNTTYTIDKLGFVDKDFNWVLYPSEQYKTCSHISNGLSCIHTDSYQYYGFMDIKGNIVIDYIYKYAYAYDDFFANDVCIVENTQRKYGIIDKSNNIVIPFIFDDIYDVGIKIPMSPLSKMDIKNATHKHETFVIRDNGNYGIIDLSFSKTNKYILEPVYSKIVSNWHNDIIMVKKGKYFTFYHKDDLQNPFLSPSYTRMENFDINNLAIVYDKGRCNLINTDGDTILPISLDRIKYADSVEKYIGIKDERQCYISQTGHMITPCMFISISISQTLYKSKKRILQINNRTFITSDGFIYDRKRR